MSDPVARFEVVQREVDRVFGDGYAAAHPDVVTAVVQSAASDWAAARLAAAIERPSPSSASCPRTSCCADAHDLGVYS